MTNRNRLATIIITVVGAGVFLLTVSSCYTILRHPRIAQADHQRPENNRCFDCHTEDEVYGYHYPVNIGRPPVDWHDTLYAPWWYDAYWSNDDTYGSRYRDTFRPGGNKSIGGNGGIRAIKPVPAETPPPSIRVDDGRNDANKREKGETPDSDKRKLRPKKKKKKDG